VAEDGDTGLPVVQAHPGSPASGAYVAIAFEIARVLALRHETTDNSILEPAQIDVRDASTTVITWSDGHTLRYDNRALRAQCPCANCVDEDTGRRIITLDQVDPKVRITAFETVGRYALQFAWSDGHSTGLYPFGTLRELGK
jgi:DUF971 family protein